MQMETVLVFAAATGRILVLPPDQPLYLLNKGKGHQNAHHFSDFFPFDLIRTRLPVIEMKVTFTSIENLTYISNHFQQRLVELSGSSSSNSKCY